MNKDIQTLIEREAEEYADSKGIYNQHGEDLLKMGFNKGAHFALSLFKWRNFTSELPCIGQRIICIGRKGNFHLSNPISHDGIHWLSENFIEWMPIPQID